MTTNQSNACPYGVLNLNAAVEAASILRDSSKAFHQHLHTWLYDNYVEAPFRTLDFTEMQPLGRRIATAEDLSTLVCAYSNARALKMKSMRKNMAHELYFYGQMPVRDAAVEAGCIVIDPDSTTATDVGHNRQRFTR